MGLLSPSVVPSPTPARENLFPPSLGRTVIGKPYSHHSHPVTVLGFALALLIQHVLACATGLLLSPVRDTVEKWE